MTTEQANDLQPVPAHVRNAIEAQWITRAQTQNLPKPHTVTYKKSECEYFIGAMAALQALGYTAPVAWVMSILSGRNIVERTP
jgi:hypothetical protein